MKFKFNSIIISSLPTIFFFLGLIFLAYSPLNISKVMTIQNDVITLFIQTLRKSDLSSSLIQTLSYLWSNILSTILIFLLLICFGFIVNILYLKTIDFRIEIISSIILIVLIFVLTNFSIVMLITALGLFLGSAWTYKTFEVKKNDFSTGYSFVSSKLKIMNVFLVMGIFLTVFMNMEAYEQQIYDSNIRMIGSLLPNATELKEVQKEQIRQISGGFKYSLTEQYRTMSTDARRECRYMYDGLIQGLENYEKETVEQIEGQELQFGEEEILQAFPFFDVIVKTTPLFTALTAYILLRILAPFLSVFSGIAYTLMKRIKPKVRE